METTSDSVDYVKYDWSLENSSSPNPSTGIAIVLGNEVTGCDPQVIANPDVEVVEIKMWGAKNSLNVAVAGPVVMFEILRRWGYKPEQ